MINTFKNLTVVIVTYKTKLRTLEKCLNSIRSGIKVIIVENSKKFKNSDHIIKKYKNLKIKIYYSKKNIGYGGGNNLGLLNTKTKFALITNPDVSFSKKFFDNSLKYINNQNNFSLIGAQYNNNSVWDAAGYFNKTIKVINFKNYNRLNLQQVDWIIGCCMLINLKNFKNKKIFDENYFLYFEELDVCQKLKKLKQKVYTSRDLIINHLGSKGSEFLEKEDYLKIRSWHYMWSFFYYHKKNYGIFKAYYLSFGRLFKFLIKTIFYYIFFNKINYIKNLYNFLGLFNSIVNKQSSFRI